MLKAGGGYLIGVRVRVFYTQPTVSPQIPDQRKSSRSEKQQFIYRVSPAFVCQ